MLNRGLWLSVVLKVLEGKKTDLQQPFTFMKNFRLLSENTESVFGFLLYDNNINSIVSQKHTVL